jgi:hypothetical protein
MFNKTLNKWELIKRFISFLRNPEDLQIKITKLNNILISQNQTWEYNKDKDCYILETDLRGKENYDKWSKDKVMEYEDMRIECYECHTVINFHEDDIIENYYVICPRCGEHLELI